ncbi:MAG: hypothetical protein WBV94_02760 [Blastocatellia bacterium]
MPQKKTPAKKPVAKKTRQNATPISRPKARKKAVAEGIALGKNDSEIARDVGISRSQVQRIKSEPETQVRIQQLLQPHKEQLERILQKSLDTIESGLDASLLNMIGMPLTLPDGTVMADHKARNQYIGNAIRLMQAAEPKKDTPIVATVTLEQLEAMLSEKGEL